MKSSSHAVLGYLHSFLSRPPGAAGDDRQLLRRVAEAREGDALAALLHRHGPMVLGLARRVAGDAETAEDVFQATFLLLARKAASIRRPESLPCWLHGVAFRLALRARRDRRRRTEREAHARHRHPPTPLDELTAREFLAVLDEELHNLPERYRGPLILCCLEGLSQEEAARRLGCSTGAVRGRLERGRERLRLRLTRRGLMLPAVFGGTLLLAEPAPAVPAALARSTLEAVRTGAGATPAAAALAREAVRGTIGHRMKAVGAAAVLLVVSGSGLGLLGVPAPAAREEKQAGGTTAPSVADRRDAGPTAQPPPRGAVLRLGTTTRRAVGARLTVTPDGDTIVGVRAGKVILFWDAATGELREKRELPGEAWGPAELSPDGRRLARVVLSPDYRVEIWDTHSGRKLRDLTIKGGGYIMPVAFSADGKLVAAVGNRRAEGNEDHLVRAWEVATGKEVFAADVRNNAGSGLLAFSPDAKRLLASFTSVYEGVYCWEVGSGERLWQQKDFGSRCVVFTPDGKILSARQQPFAVDLATGQNVPLKPRPPIDWDTFLTLTPDGKNLLISNAAGVVVWDLAAGKVLRTLPGAGEDVVALPDGKGILTNNGQLQRWDLATGRPRWADTSDLGHTGEVSVVAFSADGRRLVSASTDGTVRLWDAATGRPLRVWRGHAGRRPIPVMSFAEAGVKALDISAAGRRVVSAGSDECVKVWDVGSDRELRNIALPPRENGEAERHVYQVRISPDGRRVVGFFGPRGGYMTVGGPAPKLTDKLAVWDAETGALLEMHPVEMGGGSGVLSPDGSTLLKGEALLDVKSGKEIARSADRSGWGSAGFSRDGALVVGNAQKMTKKDAMVYVTPIGLHVWETATGKSVARLKTESWVAQAAFHPDNRFVATNDLDGIKVHDVAEREVVARFTMPESVRAGTTRGSYAGCLAFRPDGRRLATGHPDGSILLWDVRLPSVSPEPPTARELAELWDDLSDADAAKAWRATWRLAEAPGDATAFLRTRVKPHPTVPAVEMRRLLADLDDETFRVREAAAKRLTELGLRAEPGLRAALDAGRSLEQKRRIETILAALRQPPAAPTADELRQLRALAVLGRIGSPEARRILEEVAKGPELARLTRQARAALTAGPTR